MNDWLTNACPIHLSLLTDGHCATRKTVTATSMITMGIQEQLGRLQEVQLLKLPSRFLSAVFQLQISTPLPLLSALKHLHPSFC